MTWYRPRYQLSIIWSTPEIFRPLAMLDEVHKDIQDVHCSVAVPLAGHQGAFTVETVLDSPHQGSPLMLPQIIIRPIVHLSKWLLTPAAQLGGPVFINQDHLDPRVLVHPPSQLPNRAYTAALTVVLSGMALNSSSSQMPPAPALQRPQSHNVQAD